MPPKVNENLGDSHKRTETPDYTDYETTTQTKKGRSI